MKCILFSVRTTFNIQLFLNIMFIVLGLNLSKFVTYFTRSSVLPFIDLVLLKVCPKQVLEFFIVALQLRSRREGNHETNYRVRRVFPRESRGTSLSQKVFMFRVSEWSVIASPFTNTGLHQRYLLSVSIKRKGF